MTAHTKTTHAYKDAIGQSTIGVNMARLQEVIHDLESLKLKSQHAGIPEIQMIIESAFNIVFASYYCILRNQMLGLGSAIA